MNAQRLRKQTDRQKAKIQKRKEIKLTKEERKELKDTLHKIKIKIKKAVSAGDYSINFILRNKDLYNKVRKYLIKKGFLISLIDIEGPPTYGTISWNV